MKRNYIVILLGCLALAGCGERYLDDVKKFVKDSDKLPPGRVPPLPEVKPYEAFTYDAYDLIDPFKPRKITPPKAVAGAGGIQPDFNRRKEPLEAYPLENLKMVGTLRLGGRTYGLVQTRDGLVHRVLPGNHLGQADGRITGIEEGKISLIEIVPDGMGGFIERPAALALSE